MNTKITTTGTGKLTIRLPKSAHYPVQAVSQSPVRTVHIIQLSTGGMPDDIEATLDYNTALTTFRRFAKAAGVKDLDQFLVDYEQGAEHELSETRYDVRWFTTDLI